jgi:hypothetical protein
MSDQDYIRSYFDKCYHNLDKESIFGLQDQVDDGRINNVITGIHKECYAAWLIKDHGLIDYQLCYVNGENGLHAYLLELNSAVDRRDYLLYAFANLIGEDFGADPVTVHNTFQDLSRTMFEKAGYFTINVKELQAYDNRNSMLIAKGVKGIIPMAFIEHVDLFRFVFGPVKPVQPVRGVSYVYLMYNSRNHHIKIGKSWNPMIRERTLQSETPELFMIACWRADAAIEKQLHKTYEDKRLRGDGLNCHLKN